jgi:hypothetical protein
MDSVRSDNWAKNPSVSTFPVIPCFIRSPAATLNDVIEIEIMESLKMPINNPYKFNAHV